MEEMLCDYSLKVKYNNNFSSSTNSIMYTLLNNISGTVSSS